MRAEIHPEFPSVIINHETFYQKEGREFVGTAVALDLEPDVKEDIAKQIHELLLANEENMGVVSIENLRKSMDEGKSVLKLGDQNEVLGFARLAEDELAPGIYDHTTIVVGTWLGVKHPGYKNGSGKWAMENAAELALTSLKFPGALQVITKVKHDNEPPQKVLASFGEDGFGNKKVEEIARRVTSTTTGNKVNIYNVTKLGRSRII